MAYEYRVEMRQPPERRLPDDDEEWSAGSERTAHMQPRTLAEARRIIETMKIAHLDPIVQRAAETNQLLADSLEAAAYAEFRIRQRYVEGAYVGKWKTVT